MSALRQRKCCKIKEKGRLLVALAPINGPSKQSHHPWYYVKYNLYQEAICLKIGTKIKFLQTKISGI